MQVQLNGKRVRIDPSRSIGKGGEADVYDLGDGTALKLFKGEDHPDHLTDDDRAAAKRRLEEHQKKLPAFPKDLPSRVVAPLAVATERSGAVVGYSMPLVSGAEVLMRFGEPSVRARLASPATVLRALGDLHGTLAALHAKGVVVGDFNDLNVLVRGEEAHLIDADSFQFGPFRCGVFTERFIDPRLCDPNQPRPSLAKPFDASSDWYAFAVMVLQSLLCVGPWGGIYRPKDPSKRVPQSARPLARITVFHPEVQYPKPAIPYGVLPDDLLHRFHLVFEKDERTPLPRALLDTLEWKRCGHCGGEHARAVCPSCVAPAPAAIRETSTVRGRVTARSIFQTKGRVVASALHEGKLCWLAHENGRYIRESGAVVLEGALDGAMHFALRGEQTVVMRRGQAVVLGGDKPERLGVDVVDGIPALSTNARHAFWVSGGRLLRDGALGPELFGEVLAGQTRLFAGPRFGVGFYRAGHLAVSFLFNAARPGLKDTLKLPLLPGQLLDATAAIDEERAFLFVSAQVQGRVMNQCLAVDETGALLASAVAEAGDGSWLGTMSGHCASGGRLWSPTDDGVVRVEIDSGRLVEARRFPDTEPFVTARSQLFAGREGLYAVEPTHIRLLTLS